MWNYFRVCNILCVLKLLILLHMTHAWVCFGPECAHASLNFVSLPWWARQYRVVTHAPPNSTLYLGPVCLVVLLREAVAPGNVVERVREVALLL